MKYYKIILAFIIFYLSTSLFFLYAQTVGVKDSILPATKNNFLTSNEKQLLDMINQLRIENKLPIFEVDSTLTQLAREHSHEMVELKYFNANSPRKGTPKQRAALQSSLFILDYPTFAFVAKGKSITDVFSSFIKNKEAKKILLSDNKATHIGIGTENKSENEILATVHFSNRIVEFESTFGFIGSTVGPHAKGYTIYQRFKGKTKEKFLKFKAYKSSLLPEDYKGAVFFEEETEADKNGKFDIRLNYTNFRKGGFMLLETDDAGIAIFTKPSKQSDFVLRAYMRIRKFTNE